MLGSHCIGHSGWVKQDSNRPTSEKGRATRQDSEVDSPRSQQGGEESLEFVLI